MQETDPAAMSRQLRMMALTVTRDKLGLNVGPAEPFGAIMELGFPNGAVTLAAFLEGAQASISAEAAG
ncbi:MAG TPA: hypothetical protein VFW40_06340 [Capsulimonadaceae bacterium]|nr:hypothetical protein [Capsulimonadaceae bacterium]